jgi:6-phosphogluconate dehydrogenase
MRKLDIGVIGLGPMGLNLSRNLADRGFGVGVHSRTAESVAAAVKEDARLDGSTSTGDLIGRLKSPRTLLLMIPAGKPVDDQIAALLPELSVGDIVIDGGNSHYLDTVRREAALSARGLHFVGLGVSGGEEGARHGPALMAGCSEESWRHVAPMLLAIAAKAGENGDEPCCERMGENGAGHFVKMVHNGIEYAEMQALAEAYALLRRAGLELAAMAEIFERWNAGRLGSYLLEITGKILRAIDPETGRPMVEMILDAAGQKGTGVWTGIAALEMGVPAPTLLAATAARALSALKEERVAASRILSLPRENGLDASALVPDLERALFVTRLVNYAQGFALIEAASAARSWAIPLHRVAEIWRAGCIIRARILDDVASVFAERPDLPNLLIAGRWRQDIADGAAALRSVLAKAITAGVSAPVFSAALAYRDGYASALLPANLLQAQRDFFGAHGFRRTDRPGDVHHDWSGD